MAQYKLGTVDVANGSPVVTGNSTSFTANVDPGDAFTVAGTSIIYDVASVDSDTQLSLSVPYQGATATAVTYAITRDFTTPDNFPELVIGDIETPTILTRAIRKIQQKFNTLVGLSYEGTWVSGTTYAEGNIVASTDINGIVSLYIAAETSTDIEPPAAEWDKVFDGTDTTTIVFAEMSWVGEWQPSTEYFEQNVVKFGNSVYVATSNFTSGATFNIANWDYLIEADVLEQFKIDAEAARDKAQLWAEENEDVEVETGAFSAKHHAIKASDSASAAATSESNAATSETNASNSASAAATSESNAATSETNAANSASAASTSESNAATSATNAETAETGAISARDAAESLFDQFGDQYLGSLASDPTTDNDGDPLDEGDVYWNSTENVLKFYTGTAWVAPEDIATTAAQNASNSADAAATSESNAATSETNASNSASAAATSESNAATSATNASNSASAAATSATDASDSADAAAISETNASNSAGAAATSETNASNSADAAALSETNAANSEDKAQEWADAPLGTEVEPSKFSARHWAEQLGAIPETAYNWQGDWVAGTYNAGDAVYHVPSRSSYITLVTTTDEPSLDVVNDWKLLARAAQFAEAIFTDLNDTPADYGTDAGKFVQVNGTNDGLVFTAIPDYTAGAGITLTGAELSLTDESFTTTEKNKLAGVESGATADQTASEIKTAYESNADTNAFTDADESKLDGIELGATADQTASEIKAAYESNANTNEFSDSEQTKLSNITETLVTTTGVSKTLVDGEQCFVTAAAQTITLPASPQVNSKVAIGVQAFTDTVVARNGENIMGLAENLTVDVENRVVTLLYVDANEGWRIV